MDDVATDDLPLRSIAPALGVAVAVTFACFLPSLGNGLLAWDDAGYITHNPHIRTLSIETVRWAFTDFYCNDWAPLTWLSLAVDYAAWGLDPVGYHLTNAALHAVNAALFLLVTVQLLRWRRAAAGGAVERSSAPVGDRSVPTALLASLLFGVHPLRVESVAWAVERKDVLSVLFGLCAVLAYLRHARAAADRGGGPGAAARGLAPAYLASLVLYALSLASKSGLVTLPAVLLVLDAFPLRRFRAEGWRRLLAEKVPYLLLAAPVALWTVRAHAPQTKSLADVNLTTRVLVASRSLLEYLRLTILPLDVSPAYLHPGNVARVTAGHVLPVLAVLAITAWALAVAKRRPIFAAVWAVYLVTLSPVLGFFQNGPQSMAGRFTYVPAMGLSLLGALGIVALHDRARASPWARRAVTAAATAIVLAHVVLTVRDISWWRDDVALWSRSIELNPLVSGKQYFLRGLAYQEQGEFGRALADLDEARAIAESKGYRAVHEIIAARARVLRDMGDADGSLAELERAIESSTGIDRRMYLAERAVLLQSLGEGEGAQEDRRLSITPE